MIYPAFIRVGGVALDLGALILSTPSSGLTNRLGGCLGSIAVVFIGSYLFLQKFALNSGLFRSS
jgi:hypothetical protein